MGLEIQKNSFNTVSNVLGAVKNDKLSVFDKQIVNLQEQITKVKKDNNMSVDNKKSKIKEIEEQIKEVEKQKQAKQVEEMKDSLTNSGDKKAKSVNKSQDESTVQNGVTYLLTKAIVEGDNAVKSIGKTNALRKDIANEIRIAEGIDSPTPANGKEQSRLQKALARTTENLYDQIGEANKDVERSNKEISAATKAEDKDKDKRSDAVDSNFDTDKGDAVVSEPVSKETEQKNSTAVSPQDTGANTLKSNIYSKSSLHDSSNFDITL